MLRRQKDVAAAADPGQPALSDELLDHVAGCATWAGQRADVRDIHSLTATLTERKHYLRFQGAESS